MLINTQFNNYNDGIFANYLAASKWKLVGSHTARRTFATVNVLRGFRISDIRRATGHKSESAFEKYICYYDD